MSEEIKENADGTLEQGEFKVKKPRGPKKLVQKPKVSKVDLTKKEEHAVQESKPEETVLQSNEQSEAPREEVKVELQEVGSTHEEEKPTEKTEEEITVINEVVEETQPEPVYEEPTSTVETTLPENVEKLVKFMEETGGTVEDYVTLNKDYTEFNDDLLIREYYKKTKPHLSLEEINFLMEDSFSFDEEVDEQRYIRKQKLAYKEEAAKARNFLEQMKSKYYDEIKLRPSVTNEQKKAMDFFDRYNREQQAAVNRRNNFVQKTKSYFQEKFEGFDFDLGEKKFRYKISNPFDIVDAQSDITKFISKYADDQGNINDMNGYHKALYAARNADRIAQHFYEQGKADATRDIVNTSKNLDMKPRVSGGDQPSIGGFRVRAITNESDGTRLKFKTKNIK